MKKTKIIAFALAVIMVFSVVSVFASAAYTPTPNADVKTLVTDKGGIVRQLENFATGEKLAAASILNGNNGAANTYIQLYDGEEGKLGTIVSNGGANVITTAPNFERDYVDGTFGKAFRFYTYSGPVYKLSLNGTIVSVGDDIWVTESAGKYTVVPEGTAGAIKAKVIKSDDNNNCIQKYIGNGEATSLLEAYVVNLNFRYAGDVTVQQLIGPTFHGSAPGGAGTNAVSLRASDDALVIGHPDTGITVAHLDTNRYYDLTMLMYVKETGTDLFSLVIDVYLDGILVYSGPFFADYTNKPFDTFDPEVSTNNKFRYHFIAKYAKANSGVETDLDVLYVKNVQDYIIDPAFIDQCRNVVNSGNTIEGYDLTLGSNLELNYYMNLLADTVCDANAKVQFTIGEEVVAEKKVSEVSADAKGLYKFTCPVNSTQMAEDIKVSIVSGEKTYIIHQNGTALTEHTYSVAKYAKTILDSSDAKYTEAKPVVKAMLNYGAAAQTYFAAKNGTTVGTLANVGYEFTAAELGAADFGTGTVTGATEGMTATLTLDTDTVIKIYKAGALVGTSEGITADKLNDDVTITVDGGSVKVSVLTVAGKVPAAKTEFRALAQALALYSAATEAYIAD